MAEARAYQVKAAIVAKLAAIVADGGATYWITPNVVTRAHRWTDRLLDTMAGTPATVYAVRSDRSVYRETGPAQMSMTFEVFVLLLQKADEMADEAARDLIADRMERDVVKALMADFTLAGVAFNVMDPAEGIQAESFDVAGWIARELRMSVQVGNALKASL